MNARLALVVLTGIAMASLQGARGQPAATLLTADGYFIIERSFVQGAFQGCERRLEIHLGNGTIFDCNERNHHMAYRPKAVLLKNVRMRTYILLIDGRPYSGSITTLMGKQLLNPLPVTPPQEVEAGPQAAIIPGVQFPKFANSPDRVKQETLIPEYPAGLAVPIQGQ